MAEKATASRGREEEEEGEQEELQEAQRPKSGSVSPAVEEKPRSPEHAGSPRASGREKEETAAVEGRTTGGGEGRSRDHEKKRRKQDATTSESSGKRSESLSLLLLSDSPLSLGRVQPEGGGD